MAVVAPAASSAQASSRDAPAAGARDDFRSVWPLRDRTQAGLGGPFLSERTRRARRDRRRTARRDAARLVAAGRGRAPRGLRLLRSRRGGRIPPPADAGA